KQTVQIIDDDYIGMTITSSTNWWLIIAYTVKLRLGNLHAHEVCLKMDLRRGSNFYLFYDHIIAGGHFTDLALWFRSRHRSFLWNHSLGLAFGRRLSGLSGLDLRPCWGLRGGFAASPRRRRSFLAEPCCLRRMSASLDF